MTEAVVIGLGVMGMHHMRIYKELGCPLIGIADINKERGEEIGRKYNVPFYQDYSGLLGLSSIASICVPTCSHMSIATDFLHAKTNCLVEKPIASDLNEAKTMIQAAEKNNVKLMVGHIERFNPVVKELKKLIKKGVLGKILLASARRVGPLQSRVNDVGIVVDSALHDIDTIRYLIGKEPQAVYSKTGCLNRTIYEDHAMIMLDFGESMASIEVNWFTPEKERTLVVTGSKAVAYIDYIRQGLTIINSRQKKQIKIIKAEPLKTEISHFISSVKNGGEPLVNGAEGLNTLKIALAASKNISDVQR
jgi:UDP-N-acetylglucosamine 3-dehydrogenase